MEDYKDTVIVTGLKQDIEKEEFINHFKRIGDIVESKIATERCEGSVTYVDSKTAEKAVNELNGEKLNGKKIKVEMADKFYDRVGKDKGNNARSNWSSQIGGGGGGKGGKGGVGGPGVPSGHDGEDGEPGPGGKGGAGGRPAVSKNLGKRECNGRVDKDSDNKNGGTAGGKGGKGGIGGTNFPNEHDGEDGEDGPDGKPGAGGKPANNQYYQTKNSYKWNGNEQSVSWYTRLFGIGGANKNNELEYAWTGGGKGGKGGIGGPNVPRGHDGEDGEPGPGGKGGAGGRPATSQSYQSKNPYKWNGNWNSDPWYTRLFGIGGANKKSTPNYNCPGGGKGGKGGVGWNNVPSGHDGEDGEAGPGGKGGAGGRPAC